MVSRPIIRIALAAIGLGFAAMIIAISIVTGFKKEIRNKVVGFTSHIQVSNFDENNSYETRPVTLNPKLITALQNDPKVKEVRVFATKAGIIKTKDQIEGIVLKGITADYNTEFFSDKIKSGKFFSIRSDAKNDSVILSSNIAKRLNLKTGDPLIMYFIQKPPRIRKFFISGIYETGLEEFDNLYVFGDLRHIQKLND